MIYTMQMHKKQETPRVQVCSFYFAQIAIKIVTSIIMLFTDVCVFVKKRKVAASMRNRAKNPMFQTTVSEKKEAEPVLLTAAANTTAVCEIWIFFLWIN